MKKAFTLIELLVVIAIIAILAAILFPVFAQAKRAAKSSADLSNLKQQSLSCIMYSGDVDDLFPKSAGPGMADTWVVGVQPYVKNLGIFQSALDGDRTIDTKSKGLDWAGDGGVGISYGANGYTHTLTSKTDGSNCDCPTKAPTTCVLGGVIQPAGWGCASQGQPDTNWIMPFSKSQTQVTNVASTILLGDKFNSDSKKAGYVGVGSALAYTNSFMYVVGNNAAGWVAATEIPDARVPMTNAYPLSGNGAVSLTNGKVANFSFADGHAKSMAPPSTNPDPINQPDKNLWDADR